MTIRLLPPTLVNRIAAGEVLERPGAAVKELVENAIDAGAKRIEVILRDGGRSLIAVADDGSGMTPDELELAIERHATSKLPGEDLLDITSLGFRGEALPSIGAVSRLCLTSRRPHSDDAWSLCVEGGIKGALEPAAHPPGTRIEVRDLFYATPARLKFLKSTATEQGHAVDAVSRLAMAHPEIAFSVSDGSRSLLRVAATSALGEAGRLERLAALLGREFADNALALRAEREGVVLSGHVGLPTLNRGTAAQQYFFVNGRPVRDRLLLGALRGAFQDFLARDRHPVAALFLDLPRETVDVNVHPTKAEVRFRDGGMVRGLVVGAIKHALAQAGHRAATTGAGLALGAMRPGGGGGGSWSTLSAAGIAAGFAAQAPMGGLAESLPGLAAALQAQPVAEPSASAGADYPLGTARAQLHRTYILAQTADGLVIVDQHAAHERLVYERIKAAMAEGGVRRQGLLIPEVVELEEAAAYRLAGRAGELAELGLGLEAFGPGAVLIRETPALLGLCDVQGLVRDLADGLAEWGDATPLADRLGDVCGRLACHGSVRAGRALNQPEMDALLRQMEAMPHSGQCKHGRPTYVELKLADIEKLFGRR